ncbi:MAG TPA: hypothetical protein PLX97_04980, partial [Gemmatales bacterium]|nr:hypothetical protein [Gemmatales bacterium]
RTSRILTRTLLWRLTMRFVLIAGLLALVGCEKKVEINVPGAKVKVADGNVNVDAGKVKVEAGSGGVKVDTEKK